MANITQNERVLHYMTVHGSITSMEAFTELGVTRLSARIFDLRLMGHRIGQKSIKGKNRFGAVVYYDSYYLMGGNNEIQKTAKG